MRTRNATLTTDQKALAVNLDKYKYGSWSIGAGRKSPAVSSRSAPPPARIAKTMSAYDMAVSDDIYGHVNRYVSRARLLQMLDKVSPRWSRGWPSLPPKNTTFFAYAATVTARSFKQKNECHGWVGIRLQLHPGAEPSDVIMHVRMLDNDNALQSEALGILGVNLIHGASSTIRTPNGWSRAWPTGCAQHIEVNLIHFSGPYFEEVENRLMNLHLIRSWLTRAVVFNPDGEVVVPGELFYRKPVMVMRGSFKPVTCVNVDMMASGLKQFSQLAAVNETSIL